MNIYLCLFVFLITETNGLSSYWTRVLPRICSKNTPQSTTNAIMDCDRLMDNEIKNIFDNCVQEVNGFDVSQDKPKICYYSRKPQLLDNCKMNYYKERNYNISQIISKEQRHTWCLMKIARPLGWEQLCVNNLSQQKKSAIRRCEELFRDITNPIYQCFGEMFTQANDGRPAACRSFEYSNELWQCLVRWVNRNNDANKSYDLEQKANKYMDCLKNIN